MKQKIYPTSYIANLDGLRFVAALLVFIHHCPGLPGLAILKTYGYVGVDLFLAISAYILTNLALKEFKETGDFRVGNFLIRRCLRIWPLYFSYASTFCLLAVFWYEQPRQLVVSWWLSHISFTNNIITAVKGYSHVPHTAHLWTISLEEQAYLILPFILLAYFLSGIKLKPLIWFAVSAIVFLIIARMSVYLIGFGHPFIWASLLRGDPFILGSVVAVLFYGKNIKWPTLLFNLGVVLIVFAIAFEPIGTRSLFQVFGYTLTAIGSVMLVLACHSSELKIPFLSSNPIRYLGKISFGIYVYHLFGIHLATWFTNKIQINNSISIFVVGLGVTCILSFLSYEILEKPFLRLKTKY